MLKDDDHEYAFVLKKLGNGRFSVRLNLRSNEIIGRLCGKLRHGSAKKHNWVEEGSVVLVGLRDFQDDVVDITNVYDPSEVRQLKKLGHLTEVTVSDDKEVIPDDDIGFDFEEL
jgi:translation initiation factor 1A